MSISNSSFSGNTNGIFLGRSGTGAQIINNTFTLPVPPSSDVSSDFGQVSAVHITARNSYVLVASNTITGPGAVLQLQSISQLSTTSSLGALGGRTIGIIQIDRLPPAATFGRISNNTVSQVDFGIQSSSNFGVVSNNTVTNSGLGIAVSNDTDDGQTTVSDNVVTQNVATGNQIGIVMASATRNVVSLNDLRNNTLAGLAFIGNFNGAPSINNIFVLDLGSKFGAAGNQDAFFSAGNN